ncbi:hypothetical protein Q7P37_005804 [Cladosporium fusiforme]
MSQPQFTIYPGAGEWAKENRHYSQAVRIGNIIKISGQGKSITFHPTHSRPTLTLQLLGGWDPLTLPITISSDLDTEIDQAFANVELALRCAGGKGWSQVYSVRSLHIPVDEKATVAMVRNLKKWCGPDHRPIWTEIGVASLGAEGMRVEIEVEAYVE